MARFASRWAVWGFYLFAVVLVVSPLVDLLSTIWPPRMTDLSWRYGFLGLAAGYLHTPMLGVVLALAVAFWEGHTGVLRALGVASAVMAVVFVPVLALWPMDVLQMRGLRAPEAQRGVVIGGVIQEFKYLGACIVLSCLGVGSLRSAAAYARGRRDSARVRGD